jgi:hypothetical protein
VNATPARPSTRSHAEASSFDNGDNSQVQAHISGRLVGMRQESATSPSHTVIRQRDYDSFMYTPYVITAASLLGCEEKVTRWMTELKGGAGMQVMRSDGFWSLIGKEGCINLFLTIFDSFTHLAYGGGAVDAQPHSR